MHKQKVLVVDSDVQTRDAIRRHLEAMQLEVVEAWTGARVVELWANARPDLAILDYNLPDGNVAELLPRLRAINDSVPILVLAGQNSSDLAAETLRSGAEQFLTKPPDLAALSVLVQRSLENRRMRENRASGENGSPRTLQQVERDYIEEILLLEGGRVEAAARKLGIPRSSLYYKIKQYGIARSASAGSSH
jgi:DNA-binding NtrC family response regulator